MSTLSLDIINMLPRLKAWIADGEDLTAADWAVLDSKYYEDLPYKFKYADTNLIDEWISCRPDVIEDLIADIEKHLLTEGKA